MNRIASYIIAGCWIYFLAYWFVSALRTKKIQERQSLESALAHRLPVGLGAWLMVYPRLPDPLNRLILPHNDWVVVSGSAVCVLGLLITVWARRTLAGNWSSDVTFKQGHELVRSGPYRFVRHPIYTGLLAMCIGTAVETGRLHGWIGTVVIGIGFWIKLTQEERLLVRHFPEAYPVYKQQVKALVPWIL